MPNQNPQFILSIIKSFHVFTWLKYSCIQSLTFFFSFFFNFCFEFLISAYRKCEISYQTLRIKKLQPFLLCSVDGWIYIDCWCWYKTVANNIIKLKNCVQNFQIVFVFSSLSCEILSLFVFSMKSHKCNKHFTNWITKTQSP